MTMRAMELLCLSPDDPKYILDIGCGSGLSGEVLSEHGHQWLGLDISADMLSVAIESEVEGDVLLSDMGHGVPVRPGVFDCAISISALQWLCNADKKCNNPRSRLRTFFASLYNSLCKSGKAVFQFFPNSQDQVEMITESALRAGFTGGLVVDFPHSAKAKRYFLVIFCSGGQQLPAAEGVDLQSEQGTVVMGSKRQSAHGSRHQRKEGNALHKTRRWVLHKKDSQRKKGINVRADTKYTGRHRKPAF